MNDSTRPVDRRTVLRGVLLAGAGLASAPVLAACGDSADSSDEGSSGAGTAGGGGESTTGPLAPVTDVAVGSATIFADQQVVVSQPSKGEFKAFSTTCTHQGCPVDSVEGEEIVCPCHGSRYSVQDGSVVEGPATEPLAEQPVSVENDEIVLG